MENITLEHYNTVRKIFSNWCKENFKHSKGFEFGSVKSPGLSDLDLGIAIGTGEPLHLINDKIKSLPTSVIKLMNGGTLMIIKEETLKNILFIDDINISFFDKKIEINNPTPREKEIIETIQIIEWLPERIIKISNEMLTSQNRIIGYLYSLCYTLKKINKIPKNKTINKFTKNIDDLRKDWTNRSPEENKKLTDDILNRYLDTCNESISLAQQKISNYFELLDGAELEINLYSNNIIIGSSATDKFKIENNSHNNYIHVPKTFIGTYLYYCGKNGTLAEELKKRFQPKNIKFGNHFKIDENTQKILETRSLFFEDSFRLIKENKIGSGCYKFGWYINE